MDYIYHYHSPLGGITLAAADEALTGLWFDQQKYFGSTLNPGAVQKESAVLQQAKHWLDLYFSGDAPPFTPPLRLDASPFRRAVWELLLRIPYGETATYKSIADALARQRGIPNMSAQAVGGAIGHNPIALIIPCHRVIGTNGALTGYAGGIEKKRRLLQLENPDRLL